MFFQVNCVSSLADQTFYFNLGKITVCTKYKRIRVNFENYLVKQFKIHLKIITGHLKKITASFLSFEPPEMFARVIVQSCTPLA